jgi:ParB/RepB/Spo0J family partition protein
LAATQHKEQAMEKQFTLLPIDRVHPDPQQPRKFFNEEKLMELGESIVENGQLQPIEVTAVGEAYIINHGERRWRASKLMGLQTIEAIVAPAKSDDERLLAAIIENDHRASLAPVDLARAYQSLMTEHGWSKIDLSRRMKRSLPYIEARLAWLELDAEIQELVNRGKLPIDPRCSRAFLQIEDKEARVLLAQKLAASGTLSIKAVETTCAKARTKMAKAKLHGVGVSDKQMPSLKLDELTLPKGAAPSLHLAMNGDDTQDKQKVGWQPLRQAAQLMCDKCFYKPQTKLSEPAWMFLRQAAEVTCNNCPAWIPGDDLRICQECPGVLMLRQIVRQMGQAEPS